MKRIAKLQLQALNGGSANGYNGKFNLSMPTGVYREIFLNLNNLDIDQVTRISCTLNGDEFYRVDGPTLDQLRKRLKLHTNTNTIVIPFTDVSQKLVEDQNYSELVVLPHENFVMNIETAAAKSPAQDGLVASIDVRAHFATVARIDPESGKLVRHRLPRLYDDVLGINRTGSNKFRGIMTQNKSENSGRIQRVIFKTNKLQELTIRQNKVEVVKVTKDENKFDLMALGLTSSATEFLFSSVDSGFATVDAMVVGGDFEYELDMSAVEDVRTVFQGVEVYREKKLG